ncbi:helix-turn-helix domain-containing protein [Alkalihalobacillus sp. 1P02AB]|uniref:helix-turn-helix domain-containing protein n=1 Tax=Alkalihalobacillus sp. 1P02AB TaxID=3132260 RepID=UPI0039A6738A
MHRSLWIKLLIYGGIVGTIPVIIVGVFAYIQSTSQAEQRVENEKMELIRQVQSNIEQVLTTVHHSLNNTIESPTMETAIRRPLLADDFIVYRDLRSQLIKLQSFDTKVEETIVLNNDQNWIATNQGIKRFNEHPDYERYLTYFDLPYDTTWQLLETDSFEEKIIRRNCPYSISLIKKLPARMSDKFGLAFANIPMCSIRDLLGSEGVSDELMILDENNRIIVHSNDDAVGKTLAEIGFSEPEWEEGEEAGRYIVDNDHESYALTYSTSGFSGWKYVSVTSMKELLSESRSIGWFTFYVVLTMVAITALVVWAFANKLYSPVQKLVSSINQKGNRATDEKDRTEFQVIEDHLQELFSSKSSLEQELSIHSQQSLMLFIIRLFQGHFSEDEMKERLRLYELEERMSSWNYLSVLAIHYEKPGEEEDQQEKELRTFAIRNIVEDTVPEPYRLPAVWVDDLLVLLIGFTEHEDGEGEKSVYYWSEQIKSYTQRFIEAEVSIGISAPFKDLPRASIAFMEGKEALTHRLKFSENVIINYKSIEAKEKATIYQHPTQIEEELLLSIRLADKERVDHLFSSWQQEVMKEGHSIGEVQVSYMHLLNKLLRLYQESGMKRSEILLQENVLYQEALMIRSQEQMKHWFEVQLLNPLIAAFNEVSESQFKNLSEKMIDYIHQYYDQAITLEQCAADLHYNANYLSSVFKEGTKMTFSEYLTQYRLAKAKDWLVNSGRSVKAIAEELGYNNSQNFIRSFKKLTGKTPGQYRQEKQAD